MKRRFIELDFLAKWINPIYALLTWVIVFVLIKPKRILELLPVGIIAAILLFAVQLVLISLNLIKFSKGWILVSGIPLLNPLWGAAAGIIVLNYMKEDFSKKTPLILFFSAISEITTYIASQVGNISFIGRYNVFYDYILTFAMLLILTQISEGLYGNRIYKSEA
jgi:hypothetical protein